MIVPVNLDIPEEYVKDIANGTLSASKAVLRNRKNGKIVKHIDLIGNSRETEKSLVNDSGIKNLGITGLVIGGVVLIGFRIYEVVNKFNKNKNTPKCIKEFNQYFNEYLEEANRGEINAEKINKVLFSLDEVEKIDNPNIKIDFSTQEVRKILKSIYKFTKKINQKTQNYKIKFKKPSKNSSDNIIYLKDYLNYQKNVANGN